MERSPKASMSSLKNHHQKRSRKKIPRIVSSDDESSSSNDFLKKRKRKTVPLISSDESDEATKDDLNNQKNLKHDSSPEVVSYDDSSVESMDIIMYPSKSVLLKIENSKKDIKIGKKEHGRKNLKGQNQKCSVKEIFKSKTESMNKALHPSKYVVLQIENAKKNNKVGKHKHDRNNFKGRNQKCSVKEITKSKIKDSTKTKVPQKQTKIQKTPNKSSSKFSKKDVKRGEKMHTNKKKLAKAKDENITVHRKKNKNAPICKNKLKKNNVFSSKVKNSSPVMPSMKNRNITYSKISKVHDSKEELQNKIGIIKVKTVKDNLTSHNINGKDVPRSENSSQHQPQKEIQKNKIITAKVKNKKENFISHNKKNKHAHKSKTSNQHQPEKELQNNEMLLLEVKDKNVLDQNNSVSNEEKLAVHKIPFLPSSKSGKNEKSLSNKCHKVTCSGFEKVKHDFQTKESTVKKRSESYGDCLKFPLIGLESVVENESLPKCKKLTEIKNKNQLNAEGNERKKTSDDNEGWYQSINDNTISSNERIQSTIQQETTVENKNQLNAEGNERKKTSDDNEGCYEIGNDHTISSNERIQYTIQQETTVGNVETSTESQACNSSEFINNTNRYPTDTTYYTGISYEITTNHLKSSKQSTIQQDSRGENIEQSPTESQPLEFVESNIRNSIICSDYELKLINKIVNIDIRCLEEKERQEVLLKEMLKGADLLPLSFTSFDSYFSKYAPFFYLEMWLKVFESNQTNLTLLDKYFSFLVKDYKYLNGLLLLNCEFEINEDRTFILSKHDLVIVKLRERNYIGSIIYKAFGFIYDLESSDNINIDKEGELNYKCKHKNPVHQSFMMFVKNQGMVAKNSLMEGRVICSLSSEITEIEGFHLLKSSPLLNDILNPHWDTFFIPYNKQLLIKEFLEVKLQMSNIICEEVNSNPLKSKIMLLEGPPGSCKTMIIVDIAWRLSAVENQKKVLIVSPSLYSLNEIARKLQKYKDQFSSNHLRIIDISHFENMSHHDEVLKSSSIILACPRDIAKIYVFRNHIEFSCCLVDDAHQLTEPAILYPFSLNIQKFLLAGDTKQLPPKVRSQISFDFGYQYSIMDRFKAFFDKSCAKNPTIILEQQFRMCEEIASFTLKNFYSNVSHKSIHVSSRNMFHPFKPYYMFDYQVVPDSELPDWDMTGKQFMTALLNFIYYRKFNLSDVGVIFPSNEARKEFQSVIRKFPDVSFGTVDFFQGQEKPIMIISCFQNTENNSIFHTDYYNDPRKLNFALTRAVSSVIICGRINHLLQYDIWKDIISHCVKNKCYCEITLEEYLWLTPNLEKILLNDV